MKLLGGRRVRWAVVVPLAALLGCLAVSINLYRSFEVCVPESKAALTQFPAFGGAELDPAPNPAGSEGDCYASFSTTAPKDQVIGYYRQQLSAHGWAVRPGVGDEHSDLIGTRGNMCYFVAGTEPVNVSVMRMDSVIAPSGQC